RNEPCWSRSAVVSCAANRPGRRYRRLGGGGVVINPRAMLRIPRLPFWSIPIFYSSAAIVFSLIFPRFEYEHFRAVSHDLSAAAGAAFFASVAQGMLALTGVVFALAFVMIQFASTAYSPRLVLWVSRDPAIWHCLGIFTATFVYALTALIWVDRAGS